MKYKILEKNSKASNPFIFALEFRVQANVSDFFFSCSVPYLNKINL